MLHKLADMGIVKFTDPVTKFFNDVDTPAFRILNPYDEEAGADAVTLESLASQSSGIPRQSPCINYTSCKDVDVMDFLATIPLWHQPLTSPHYSDIAYAILGHCLERAIRNATGTNITYEQFMKENIFDPFEMTSTGYDYPDDIRARMAGACL